MQNIPDPARDIKPMNLGMNLVGTLSSVSLIFCLNWDAEDGVLTKSIFFWLP